MTTMTVRVPKELKKKMALFSDVDWGDDVKEALSERVELETRRRKMRDEESLKEASVAAGRILEKIFPTCGKIPYSSAELIRQWRDAGWTTSWMLHSSSSGLSKVGVIV